MANYETLKSAIQQVVKTNGNNEISGAFLQQSLLAMINSLGAGYQFVDAATPKTNPGTPDNNVFYIASTAGTYSNFNNIVLTDGEVSALAFNGSWTKINTNIASKTTTDERIKELAKASTLINGSVIKNINLCYSTLCNIRRGYITQSGSWANPNESWGGDSFLMAKIRVFANKTYLCKTAAKNDNIYNCLKDVNDNVITVYPHTVDFATEQTITPTTDGYLYLYWEPNAYVKCTTDFIFVPDSIVLKQEIATNAANIESINENIVTKTVLDSSQINGYYRNISGGLSRFDYFFATTTPIPVSPGVVFKANNVSGSSAQSTISMLCWLNSDGSFISNILNPSGAGTYTYTFEKSGYVGISGYRNDIAKFSIIYDKLQMLPKQVDANSNEIEHIKQSFLGELFERKLFDIGSFVKKTKLITISRGKYYTKTGVIGTYVGVYSITNKFYLPGGTYRQQLADGNAVGTVSGQSACVFDLQGNFVAGYSAGEDGYYESQSNKTYVNFTIPDGGGYVGLTCHIAYAGLTDEQIFDACELSVVSDESALNILIPKLYEYVNTRVNSIQNYDSSHLPTLTENPIEHINYVPGLTQIFSSAGIIGDSLASGEMQGYHDDGSLYYRDMYEFSWGQQIAKLTGMDVYNFSNGGQSTKGWMQGTTERTWQGAQTNLKQCYFIGLGHNDKTRVDAGDYASGIGTVEDINDSDYTQNADSYVGWYARIIQAIKSVQPRAYIFCITTKAKNTYAQYNAQVRNIVSHFAGQRVYLIDLETYEGDNPDFLYMGNHLSAAGYLYCAYEIMTYVDWIVRKNPNDFRYTSLVGTDIKDTNV